MKKIITLLLALVLSLCAPIYALAATPDESDFCLGTPRSPMWSPTAKCKWWSVNTMCWR